jgi:phosphoglycolate phosphatase
MAAPGALSVVGWLRTQNYRIGVSTNAAASHARDELERLGILRSLDFLAGFNSGFGAKPAPGHVLAFSAAIEVPTSEIVCVGDSPYDLEAARRAGAIPIGVLGGSAALDALAPLARHVIGTLEDLPVLLGTLDT